MSSERDGPALGNDPFGGRGGTAPYLERLDGRSSPAPTPGRAGEDGYPDLGPPIPELSRIETPDEARDLLDRFAGLILTAEEEARFSQARETVDAHPYDAFGLSPKVARRSFALFSLLYRYYFRVESCGHGNIPEKGAAILAANHGGLLPFDGAMMVVDAIERGEPPRVVRTVVDRWAGGLPFVNVFYARTGQVIGTRSNVRGLLEREQLVSVFPEGVAGIRKRAVDRYKLQDFHVGFVEESLRYRAPIVPVAVVGADDQSPILWDIKPLAKLLGLPVFPITPTFPLLGPVGLLPYPVRYEIEYGEPFHFYADYPPSALTDPGAIAYMVGAVRDRIQTMVDHNLRRRRSRVDE